MKTETWKQEYWRNLADDSQKENLTRLRRRIHTIDKITKAIMLLKSVKRRACKDSTSLDPSKGDPVFIHWISHNWNIQFTGQVVPDKTKQNRRDLVDDIQKEDLTRFCGSSSLCRQWSTGLRWKTGKTKWESAVGIVAEAMKSKIDCRG